MASQLDGPNSRNFLVTPIQVSTMKVRYMQDQRNEAHFYVQFTTSQVEDLRATSHTSQGP